MGGSSASTTSAIASHDVGAGAGTAEEPLVGAVPLAAQLLVGGAVDGDRRLLLPHGGGEVARLDHHHPHAEVPDLEAQRVADGLRPRASSPSRCRRAATTPRPSTEARSRSSRAALAHGGPRRAGSCGARRTRWSRTGAVLVERVASRWRPGPRRRRCSRARRSRRRPRRPRPPRRRRRRRAPAAGPRRGPRAARGRGPWRHVVPRSASSTAAARPIPVEQPVMRIRAMSGDTTGLTAIPWGVPSVGTAAAPTRAPRAGPSRPEPRPRVRAPGGTVATKRSWQWWGVAALIVVLLAGTAIEGGDLRLHPLHREAGAEGSRRHHRHDPGRQLDARRRPRPCPLPVRGRSRRAHWWGTA